MLCYAVLLLVRKLDKKDTLWNLCGRANLAVLLLMALGLWGSARSLNAPIIEIYRNGIYLFAFFAGYFLFSHDHVQELLKKWALDKLLCLPAALMYPILLAWMAIAPPLLTCIIRKIPVLRALLLGE